MTSTLTAEIMADIQTPTGVQISPDGSRVVVSVGSNTREGDHRRAAVWLATVGDPNSARKITSGTFHDADPRWSSDGKSVSFLSDRDKRGTSQIYLLSLSLGGEAQRLTNEPGGVSRHEWLSGEANRIAYLSPDAPDPEEEKRRKDDRDDAKVWGEFWPFARLKVLNLDSDTTVCFDLGERHISGMSGEPEGNRLVATTSKYPDLDSIGTSSQIYLVDIIEGSVQLICSPDRMFGDMTWSADGETVFAIAPAGPVPAVSSSQLWSFGAHSGAEPILHTADLAGCIRNLARGSGDETLYGVVQTGVETGVFALDQSSGSFGECLHFAGDLSELSISHDGSVAVTLASTPTRPFDVYKMSLPATSEDHAFEQLTSFHTGLDDIEFGPQEVVTWERNGFALDGIVLWPPGHSADDGPLPTCVSVHGGPYGRWANAFGYARPFAHWLAAQGFLVFMPNARGGSGHGEAFASAVLDSVGKEDWLDILAGIDLIVERGWADKQRMGIGGWSQGGFMTAWAVGHDADDSQRFKCAVMGAGVSDWGMMVATSDVPTFEQRLGGGNPFDSVGPHEFDKWSPISYVHRATTPTLILHGENDERVPVSQAVFMHRGLRKYGCETDLVIYPREPHGLQERRHVIDLHERIAAWYRDKL